MSKIPTHQELWAAFEHGKISAGTTAPVTQWRGRLPCHYWLNKNILLSFVSFRIVYRGVFAMVKPLGNGLLHPDVVEKQLSNDCMLLKKLVSVKWRTTGERNKRIGIANGRTFIRICKM